MEVLAQKRQGKTADYSGEQVFDWRDGIRLTVRQNQSSAYQFVHSSITPDTSSSTMITC